VLAEQRPSRRRAHRCERAAVGRDHAKPHTEERIRDAVRAWNRIRRTGARASRVPSLPGGRADGPTLIGHEVDATALLGPLHEESRLSDSSPSGDHRQPPSRRFDSAISRDSSS
jgi:hypothetical protein